MQTFIPAPVAPSAGIPPELEADLAQAKADAAAAKLATDALAARDDLNDTLDASQGVALTGNGLRLVALEQGRVSDGAILVEHEDRLDTIQIALADDADAIVVLQAAKVATAVTLADHASRIGDLEIAEPAALTSDDVAFAGTEETLTQRIGVIVAGTVALDGRVDVLEDQEDLTPRVVALENAPAPASSAADVTYDPSFEPIEDTAFGGEPEDNASVQAKLDYLTWRVPRHTPSERRDASGRAMSLEERLSQSSGTTTGAYALASTNFSPGQAGPFGQTFGVRVTSAALGLDATYTLGGLEAIDTLEGLVEALNGLSPDPGYVGEVEPRPYVAAAQGSGKLCFVADVGWADFTIELVNSSMSVSYWHAFGQDTLFNRGRDFDVSFTGVYDRSTGRFLDEGLPGLGTPTVIATPATLVAPNAHAGVEVDFSFIWGGSPLEVHFNEPWGAGRKADALNDVFGRVIVTVSGDGRLVFTSPVPLDFRGTSSDGLSAMGLNNPGPLVQPGQATLPSAASAVEYNGKPLSDELDAKLRLQALQIIGPSILYVAEDEPAYRDLCRYVVVGADASAAAGQFSFASGGDDVVILTESGGLRIGQNWPLMNVGGRNYAAVQWIGPAGERLVIETVIRKLPALMAPAQ